MRVKTVFVLATVLVAAFAMTGCSGPSKEEMEAERSRSSEDTKQLRDRLSERQADR